MRYTSSKSSSLTGTVDVPGDKSMSHRSIMFGLLAAGTTTVKGLLTGEDVMCTADAARALGASVTEKEDGTWVIESKGLKHLTEPDRVLDMGNSGTSTRLLMGLVAGYDFTCTFTGDHSLIKRPMARISDPLTAMGAKFITRTGGRLPLSVKGSAALNPISYELPVASAQVKSAILLAGLNAEGNTSVIETKPTRDHTENMLRHFGAVVDVETLDNNAQKITVHGKPDLKGCDIVIPADPSSAAFPVVAAILTEGSDIRIENVGMNERRAGVFTTLIEMGADITIENARDMAGEPVADLHVKYNGPLSGINVPAERVPSMIDEFPILSVAAACAKGTTTITDLAELRVKESDRLLMVAEGLKKCGVELEMAEDSLTVHGTGNAPKGTNDADEIETALDHRIAMSFLVLGLATQNPVTIDDGSPIATSFPSFIPLMRALGAKIDTV